MSRDLFAPVVPLKSTHSLFRSMKDGPGHEAARQMMNLVFADFHDVDHSFVKEFQTGGFSARVFELALFAYLQEQDLELDRAEAAPDFVVRGALPVAIEVTTTNPPQGTEPTKPEEFSWLPEDMPADERAFVFQLGKALRKKMTHRDAQGRSYWEKPHVAGVPFVIAVGAFHNDHAQWHPVGAASQYLYGQREVVEADAQGNQTITRTPIDSHNSNGKSIPSGLFKQPEAANLAGVLFSNAHTVSMFNRIGTELELGSPKAAMCRVGTRYNASPNAIEPLLFGYVVGDRPPGEHETFAEGLHLFLNPWATTPLRPEALPMVTFHTMEHGLVSANYTQDFQPFLSRTMIFEGEGADVMARYTRLKMLGLVPDAPPR